MLSRRSSRRDAWVGRRLSKNTHPAPKSQKPRDRHPKPENRAAKFNGSKSCGNRSAYLGPARCAYRGQCRSRTWQSHHAGPQASPLVYTAQEKDPRHGLRCPHCWPPRAPCPGFPILSGAPTFSLPLIPWRCHGSRPGEAQSEEAACCGWAVTSLGQRPACCVAPRESTTPLGLAGGGEPWRPGLHRSLARGRGTAVRRGLVGVPLPSPPPCRAAGRLPPCAAPPPPPGVRVPLLVLAVTPSWASHPLPVPGCGGGLGFGGWGLLPCPLGLGWRKAGGGGGGAAPRLPLGEWGVWWGEGEILWCLPGGRQ